MVIKYSTRICVDESRRQMDGWIDRMMEVLDLDKYQKRVKKE